VDCVQKTEKGLSGYIFNKQTGLVNKVRALQLQPQPLCVCLLFAYRDAGFCSIGKGVGASSWAAQSPCSLCFHRYCTWLVLPALCCPVTCDV